MVKNRESTVRRHMFFFFLHYTHGSLDETTIVDTKLLFARFDRISFFCISIQRIHIGPWCLGFFASEFLWAFSVFWPTIFASLFFYFEPAL